MGTSCVRQQPPVEVSAPQPRDVSAARHVEFPRRFLRLEQPPVSAFDDNPVFDEASAATILGLSRDLLKKWRNRDIGPNYIQYGSGGPVRYSLNDLMAFRLAHTIRTESMPERIELRQPSKVQRRSTR